MARLLSKPYPGEWDMLPNEDWEAYDKRVTRQYNKIDKDNIIKFPVADGYAEYYVVSVKPLVLQHIPIYDAYRIPQAHIRGLRSNEVKEKLENQKKRREFFSKK